MKPSYYAQRELRALNRRALNRDLYTDRRKLFLKPSLWERFCKWLGGWA